jgi:hypothetical protein
MEAMNRKPFQGTWNIIRFNWHFYFIAAIAISLLLILRIYSSPVLHTIISVSVVCFLLVIVLSLSASFFIYDLSSFYRFEWLKDTEIEPGGTLVNIHAGFDETSAALAEIFPFARLLVFDFYNPQKHTEPSIKRARKAYPPYKETITISTGKLPLGEGRADHVFCIMSLHEIRNRDERIMFLQNLQKALKPTGGITVVEHLRDLPNLLVYTIGFFHFFSKKEWRHNFNAAGLAIQSEKKITPFISCFLLTKSPVTNHKS